MPNLSRFRFENAKIIAKGLKTPLAFRITKEKKQNIQSPRKEKKELKTGMCANLDYLPKIEQNRVEISLNVRTYSEANSIDCWQKKHKRHKKQKNSVFWAYLEVKQHVKYPCTITFVRYAPKTLDAHDNLPMSMKWICDALCAEITQEHRPGLADNFEGLKIKYDQVKCKKYGVKIIIEF